MIELIFEKELMLIIQMHHTSHECNICHYWCFKDIGFKYEPDPCNGCLI